MIKNKPLTIVFLLACLLNFGLARAQEAVNSAGGDAVGAGGKVAYSIGQVAYISNSNGMEDQGVQHAYEIYTFAIQNPSFEISLNVFPNPTTDYLTLLVSDLQDEQLSYQVYDELGKTVSNGSITAQQTEIKMTTLPSATYFIHIINHQSQEIKSFKIIKL
jgi:hypothetical protein